MKVAEIKQAILNSNLTESDIVAIFETLKLARHNLGQSTMCAIRVGSKVQWYGKGRGEVVSGTVTKVNRTRVEVNVDGSTWAVPASMLTLV